MQKILALANNFGNELLIPDPEDPLRENVFFSSGYD